MTCKKYFLNIITTLFSLLSLIPNNTSAYDNSFLTQTIAPHEAPKSFISSLLSQAPQSNRFSFQHSFVPLNMPKAAVVEINANNQLAEQYVNDLLLSMQNELLFKGIDIVIGKENATDNNTLVLKIDFSIESGLLSHVRSENHFNYFVENISRVTYNASFFTTSKKNPFIELSLNLDTQILGLTENSYDFIESVNGNFGRSTNLIANLFFAVFSDKTEMTGTWQDILNSTVIEVPNDHQSGEYTGYLKSVGKVRNFGFSPQEKTYRFSDISDKSSQITGEVKVRYSNGREPEWLPAEFIFFGNIMILKPTSRRASKELTFFIKRPQQQTSILPANQTNL